MDEKVGNSGGRPRSRLGGLGIVLAWSVICVLVALRSARGLAACFIALAILAAVAGRRGFRAGAALFFLACAFFSIGVAINCWPWGNVFGLRLAPLCLLASVSLVVLRLGAAWLGRRPRPARNTASVPFRFNVHKVVTAIGLLLVTVVWLTVEEIPARRQRLAVKAICESGYPAEVVYMYWSEDDRAEGSEQRERIVFHQYGMRRWPKWAERLLGHDFFDNVAHVILTSSSQLPACKAFPQLEQLDLLGPRFTDDDLRFVGSLTQVKDLKVRGSPVTDAALESLGGNCQLKSLCLSNTSVTDAGVERFWRANPTVDVCVSRKNSKGVPRVWSRDSGGR